MAVMNTPVRKSARIAASPARTRTPEKKRSSGPKKNGAAHSDDEFKRSVSIFLACVSALGISLVAVLYNAPPAPAGGVCDKVSLALLPEMLKPATYTSSVLTVWRCATAYQSANWWFVLFLYELAFLGLKTLAIPVSFVLSIVGGAIFPFPLSHLLITFGETFGSTMCYLLSSAIAKPILERLAPEKLVDLRAKVKENREHMFLFNIFLRLSPFPNWLVNASSPIVNNPLKYFISGTYCGTFFPLLLLGRCGWVLRDAGENGFDVLALTKANAPYMAVLFSAQFLPLYLIRRKKRLAEAAKKQKKKK